jgi:aminobutyraldehyde dehydrogenase
MDTSMLIGSAFEAGAKTAEAVLDPKTGSKILHLPEASPAQIDRAVAAARRRLRHGRGPPRRNARCTS